MKIEESHIGKLSKLIIGDAGYVPYLNGLQIVEMFNRCCSFNDEYGQGFPTRHVYTANKLKEINGTAKFKKVIEEVADPYLYLHTNFDVKDAVDKINEILSLDGFELRASRKKYKVYSIEEEIKPETLLELEDDFLTEQIQKCDDKIKSGDFDGAITNARTMVETVIKHILSKINNEYEYKGDIMDGYKEIKNLLKLNPAEPKYPDYIKKTLAGLISIVDGIAETRNKMSDSHARQQKPEKHHAKLAVNAAKTLSEFLIDSFNKQFKRREKL